MSEQRDLEGLGALVTGATSGIGRAAAEELGLSAAALLDEAVHHLSPDEEDVLREFAERRERIEP